MTLMSAAFAVAPGAAQTHSSDPAISLSISVPQATVRAGGEVRVKIVLRNLTDHELLVGFIPLLRDDTGDVVGFKGTVTDADGKLAPYTELGARVRRYSDKGNAIEALQSGADYVEAPKSCVPGLYSRDHPPRYCGPCTDKDIEIANRNCGQLVEELVVSRRQDMSKPGVYSIQLEHGDPEGSMQWVKSNVVKVTITP
jgi:hypothetical protein